MSIEENTGILEQPKCLTNWVEYEAIIGKGANERPAILRRLEGFMRGGMVVSNADLASLLDEQQVSYEELRVLGEAQSHGIRKGLDLGYNTASDFLDAHAERIRNLCELANYKNKKINEETAAKQTD